MEPRIRKCRGFPSCLEPARRGRSTSIHSQPRGDKIPGHPGSERTIRPGVGSGRRNSPRKSEIMPIILTDRRALIRIDTSLRVQVIWVWPHFPVLGIWSKFPIRERNGEFQASRHRHVGGSTKIYIKFRIPGSGTYYMLYAKIVFLRELSKMYDSQYAVSSHPCISATPFYSAMSTQIDMTHVP